jgi:hypothetical protein
MTAATTLDTGAGFRPMSYRTPSSACEIVVTTPAAAPHLWEEYLDGALATYGAHGVASALDLDQIRDGESTSLFFVAFAPDGRAVGGMRSQGPYTAADQAHAVGEWEGNPDQPTVRAMVDDRLPFGVVESKTAWVTREFAGRRELVSCLSRAPLHASMLLGARYALGTSAAHTIPMWTSSGAVAATGLSSVGYPTADYRTVVLWWDRWGLPGTLAEGEKRAIDDEMAQLVGPPAAVGGR